MDEKSGCIWRYACEIDGVQFKALSSIAASCREYDVSCTLPCLKVYDVESQCGDVFLK
jgi:hypothetical protein